LYDAYSCDADDRQVLCKGSSNCIDSTEAPHSEGHSKTSHSCEYTASIALSASKVLTYTLHQSALLTLSPGIAICGVACFQLIAAIDHPQVFVGVQLVKQRHVEVPRHTEVVRNPNFDKPSSYVRSQASGRHVVSQKQARGNLKVSWYAAERYRDFVNRARTLY